MTDRKDTKLWGGRFDKAPDARFDSFQRSFAFDRRLLPYEIAVDRAWAKALEPIGIFSANEVKQTLAALDKIEERAENDHAWLEKTGADAEDVHHFVEKALVEELGPLGWKLHTGRSRNELVATDFRLFIMDAASETEAAVRALIEMLSIQANVALDNVVPMAGMTHMQHAQPILLAHFFLAHAEAFLRDIRKLRLAAEGANVCPMGSGALAGNSLGIDRRLVAAELGFTRITANSLDAVSDRDFALDYLFALTGVATHLSRLAEDLVIFASQEFAYAILPDEFSTGSSLMPQKKNPDCWELIRGKSGRINAALVGLLTTLKGLPTSYQRDLQEDKEILFDAHDQVTEMVLVAASALFTTRFNEQRLLASASDPALLATEAADYLVRKGVPFRQAHDIVGKVLKEAEGQRITWTELPLSELRKFSTAFSEDLKQSLTLTAALAAKNVPGGTSPEQVKKALAALDDRDWGDEIFSGIAI
ncbi:MAG: argininosuccinate lyase [Acidobacteria bacterium]|nr:argininosuccinate lyase [Acidobacteriota bacterium]MBS1864450.1 argininosuccinate lyase [Acidobacteriota bacterium]